jgi:hypothetical protein
MLMSVVMLSFVVLTTDGPSDPELHWVQGNVPYKFNDAGSADMGPEVYPAVEAGFQVWNDASGVDYSYAGCTSKGRGSVINGSGDASADGDSIITWIENSWPYGPSTIAITWTYFFEDGEIGEADMLMNGDDYNWTTSTAGGETDVASIAAHEAGHYLGLGHTNASDTPTSRPRRCSRQFNKARRRSARSTPTTSRARNTSTEPEPRAATSSTATAKAAEAAPAKAARARSRAQAVRRRVCSRESSRWSRSRSPG